MRMLLLVFLISACNGLGNPFASSGSDASSDDEAESTSSNNGPKDSIVDSTGKVIGTLETANADLDKNFTVRMEDGTRVVLNNSSSTIIMAEGAPSTVAFTNSGCNTESGFDGAIVQTEAKGAFPLTIDGQSKLYIAGEPIQGTIQSFLVRLVPTKPDLSCKEQPPTADPITKKGYKLFPYDPPFNYPFSLPFSKKSP